MKAAAVRLLVAIAFLLCGGHLIAQEYQPPTFSTSPSPPIPNEAFQATLNFYSFFMVPPLEDGYTATVSGNTITVLMDLVCPLTCTPPYYGSTTFDVAPLNAGEYVIRFVSLGDTFAEFPLIVGAVSVPVPTPTLDRIWLVLLILLLAFVVASRTQRRGGKCTTN